MCGVLLITIRYPFTVSLLADGYLNCAGALISPSAVLTAAHCLAGAQIAAVTVGVHDKTAFEEDQLTVVSTNVVAHENYAEETRPNFDVAVIYLDPQLTLDGMVASSVSLTAIEPALEETVTAMGWGENRLPKCGHYGHWNSRENERRQLGQPSSALYQSGRGRRRRSLADLRRHHRFLTVPLHWRNYVGYLRRRPVMAADGTLVGVVSFGPSAGCVSGFPDYHSSIVAYADWIEEKTGVKAV